MLSKYPDLFCGLMNTLSIDNIYSKDNLFNKYLSLDPMQEWNEND